MGYIGAGPTRFNTADSLNINGDGATVTGIKDEDNMASNSAVKLATQQSIKAYVDSQIGANNELSEVLANGNTTGGNDISFADNDKAIFGAGSDLQIYHDGSSSYILDGGTGDLRIWADNPNIATSGGNKIFYGNNGVAELYYTGGVKRLETTSGGIDVTGSGTFTKDSGNVLVANRTTNDGDFIQFKRDGTTVGNIGASSSSITFASGGSTERMRVDTSGNLIVGGTTADSATSTTIYSGGQIRANTSSTNAVILDRRDSDGSILEFKKDDVSVGLIGTASSYIYMANGDTGIAPVGGTDRLLPVNGSGAVRDAAIDMGYSGGRFRDLYLSGKTFISDGGAGNPAYTFGNDTDTGIFRPTGNQIGFTTGGSERMRIDSSGNVGIGDSVVQATLHVKSAGTAGLDVSQGVKIEGYGAGGNGDAACLAFAAGDAQVKGAITFTRNNSYGRGYMSFLVNNDASFTNPSASDEKMRIDGSGNVGIGTTTPSQKLEVNGGIALQSTQLLRWNNAGTITGSVAADNSNNLLFYNGSANTERMRIDTSGNLLVGTTSATFSETNYGIGLKDNAESNWVVNTAANIIAFSRGSNGNIFKFFRSGEVGSVYASSTGTTYNTTSDIRLKTDIAPISDATDKLMAMNAVSHKWKAEPDADAVHGFIAQEMAEIVPEAVKKGEGEDDMWSMDYGRITPVLVAALQDAHKKIEQLEQRIAEMEAK